MRRRLFLTGPIGCGKSTAIRSALGERLCECGGLLTIRHRQPHLHFTLETPDGAFRETFLDFSQGKPSVDLTPFSRIGLEGRVLVLDEIGGIELLNPDFVRTLDQILRSDVPVLGVLKGRGPAGKLIETLGLTQEYTQAAEGLRRRLEEDPDTLVYECGQFDENGQRLAAQWVEEYLRD